MNDVLNYDKTDNDNTPIKSSYWRNSKDWDWKTIALGGVGFLALLGAGVGSMILWKNMKE